MKWIIAYIVAIILAILVLRVVKDKLYRGFIGALCAGIFMILFYFKLDKGREAVESFYYSPISSAVLVFGAIMVAAAGNEYLNNRSSS